MLQANRDRKLAGALLAAAFGIMLGLAGSIGTAFAQDADDDEGLLPDQKFFRAFMRGIGLRDGKENEVNARERSPLVVPPSLTLPPPVAAGAVAQGNAAWPADPDEKRRKDAKKARNTPRTKTAEEAWIAAGNSLTPAELAAGKTGRPGNQEMLPTAAQTDRMTPSELGYVGGMWNSFTSLGSSFSRDRTPETAQFVREPSRGALTDPPAGYRTPSPEQPYGINAKKATPQAKEDRQLIGTGQNTTGSDGR